jgi:tetratricopeptide (TPR) repeat protein
MGGATTVNRQSLILTGKIAVIALFLGAVASGRGDDLNDPLASPLPLFAPPDSIRLMPPGSETSSGNSPIESNDQLYDRLRQSLLDLERRLQAESESPVVPDPPLVESPYIEEGTQGAPVVPEPGIFIGPESTTPAFDPEVEVIPPMESTDITTPTVEPVPSETVEPSVPATTTPLAASTLSSPNVPALADNLYALGEYDLAYNSYEQLDMESLSTENQIWVTYQLAGCLRHLNQVEAAAGLYRNVLSQHPEHHLAGVSRWWLDAMEDQAEQSQAAAAFRATLERMRELQQNANATP